MSPQPPVAFPTESGSLQLMGPAGSIECLVDLPDPDTAKQACAVLCHPHPQHGGTMRNKVVTIMERSFRELGLATVRFNFRGVGDSEGQFGEGVGEADDLKAVLDWVQTTRPNDVLWLGGFSFGAYISIQVAHGYPIGQLLSVAPPAGRFDLDTLTHPNCPWLVVQGTEDEVVSASAVQAWAEALNPPPELVMMDGAGHFFHRRLMDLRGVIKNHAQGHLPAS
ncbi:MAG: alpha/beta hydrolase [Wenzhouxiangella sp.]|nr:alpha/beta hydrolase [Wenzhouxiangella sp.]